ncbi:MAG: amino acid adenylation domain-containing protein [Oribacterium sp.]|nr:amino acid adenylation domain-containing protein [Oribacterium sp.]
MIKNVLEYLEASEKTFPGKTAYMDKNGNITFGDLGDRARRLGSFLARKSVKGKPVAVFMEKSVNMILGFLGTVYAGGFYCPIDVTMPEERIRTIFSVLNPAVVLTREADREKVTELMAGLDGDTEIAVYEEAIQYQVNASVLNSVRNRSVDSDPLYVLFTSGSTGVPKGVVVPHRVMINNMEWLEREYHFTSEEVLGNQVPFYFDVSDHDIYSVLKFGCSMVIVPSEYFAFPVKLVQFLNEYKVSAIFWVPFALCMAANLDAFKAEIPKYLKYIFFAGEVMPVKQLNYWRKHLPDALYANMYGPTETYVCTYYNLDREFNADESLPIGFPVSYADILVLDEEGKPVEPAEDGTESRQGELCARGCTLALGYMNSPEKTAERFVQNPLQKSWPEIIYRTGDIVRYNSRGELEYLSRKDFQIKHLGYRIELGEIETAAGAVQGVETCACVYDLGRKMIVLVYSGKEISKRDMLRALESKIPKYMLPNRMLHLEELPHNANGKIDRKKLEEMVI